MVLVFVECRVLGPYIFLKFRLAVSSEISETFGKLNM